MSHLILAATDALNNPTVLAVILCIATVFGITQTVWFYKLTQKSKGQSRHSGDIIYLLLIASGTIAAALIAVVLLLFR